MEKIKNMRKDVKYNRKYVPTLKMDLEVKIAEFSIQAHRNYKKRRTV